MTRTRPALAARRLGAASAPAVVRALHPWTPSADTTVSETRKLYQHETLIGETGL
jgi:hypothetical protein